MKARRLEKQLLRWRMGHMAFIRRCSWDQPLGKRKVKARWMCEADLWPPKNNHIPRTCEYVALCGKEDSADAIKLKNSTGLMLL